MSDDAASDLEPKQPAAKFGLNIITKALGESESQALGEAKRVLHETLQRLGTAGMHYVDGKAAKPSAEVEEIRARAQDLAAQSYERIAKVELEHARLQLQAENDARNHELEKEKHRVNAIRILTESIERLVAAGAPIDKVLPLLGRDVLELGPFPPPLDLP